MTLVTVKEWVLSLSIGIPKSWATSRTKHANTCGLHDDPCTSGSHLQLLSNTKVYTEELLLASLWLLSG